jgi:arabinofuranan 3-O-arabinosyltransferase
MNDLPLSFQAPRGSILPLFWHPWTRYAAAWGVALVMSGIASYYAWYDFRKPNRAGETDGHRAIDFGGQYLMGRMLQQGHGRELYFRETQRTVLEGAYPRDEEDPEEKESDADHLMKFTMGEDDSKGDRSEWERRLLELAGEDAAINPPHIGGPLYPPINAFLSYPLAWMPPRLAYRVNQGFNLVLAFLAALAANRLTGGRLWWPVALCFTLIFPGFAGTFCLGQNAALTLNILLWGWFLVSRDRPVAGGLVWGLLAFKPVWLLSFLLVPLLSRRWRMALTMLATAAFLALVTLPFVGVHGWLDWLRIGREAAVWYETDENWIFMSRDLYSIPRRWLLDFSLPVIDRIIYPEWTRILSISLPVAALLATVTIVCMRNRRVATAKEGPAAAFLLLGAWLICYHFMYYDVLLAALPVCLLFTHPFRCFEPLFLGLRPFGKSAPDVLLVSYFRPSTYFQRRAWLPFVTGGYGQVFLVNSLVLSLFVLLVSIQYVGPFLGVGVYKGPPLDTFVLIGFWVWCGYRLLVDKDEVPAQPEESRSPLDQTNNAIMGANSTKPWDGVPAGPAASAKTGIRAEPL